MSLDFAAANSKVNDLLVEIHRSLTQYAREAWTWSRENGSGGLRDAVSRAAHLQTADVQRLAKFLAGRGLRVDFGVYPHEYTSLHYVAIDYLASQLVENQRGLVRMLEGAWTELAGDDAAQALTAEVTQTQRQALADLSAVAGSGQPVSAWMK